MRFSIAVVASVLAGVVYSQTIQNETNMLPPCSLTCLTNAISNAGCSLTDYACQCGPQKPAIQVVAAPCIVSSCNTTEALATQKITMEICQLQAAQASNSSSSLGTPATSSTGVANATTSGGSSIVTSTGSSIGSSIVSATTTSIPASTTQAASSTTSPTPTVSKAAAPRLEAFGAIAGAAILAAFAF